MKRFIYLPVIVLIMAGACTTGADNPTNAARGPDNAGPDTGWTNISDYERSTVTTDTMPRVRDSGVQVMDVMPAK